jgi:hypothetical protein
MQNMRSAYRFELGIILAFNALAEQRERQKMRNHKSELAVGVA